MVNIQQIKQRYGIIGNSEALNRAIDVAVQVAPTDLSVLITGESGTGKEVFPQIIHQHSIRKHGSYVAVNCGAIPEGTIDSELFGHEKGAFTGAYSDRKGYFEEANEGTIFLDEIGELPLATQVRLLRVLETGEFMRVGSSRILKTNVRVVAATNVNLEKAIKEGKFREDLFYRLNSVPINIPPLRERVEDIYLLFRKFAADFADRYRMPAVKLDQSAREMLERYRWPGNIRQLKNITEQISIIEKERVLTASDLQKYLPYHEGDNLPALIGGREHQFGGSDFSNEREILYKVLFDMKRDMNDLKKLVLEILQHGNDVSLKGDNAEIIQNLYQDTAQDLTNPQLLKEGTIVPFSQRRQNNSPAEEHHNIEDTEELVEESLSLEEKEVELIKKALEKHSGKRKQAAKELGISERTLYRKIKEHNIEG
ncbi:sigma-54 interaction domain-containing protein [Anaerophaga thermohalophila]|jgi:transcriptional regulator with PAS, ATPase and Fis domain|uniref:sigma-54 interaction domain-containing protein n=1 Tax=Anaerophaga thermohalophila TaxID=177400 RepID=UPI000301BF3E|nr:sigma-54 dependent transcriptional regulator [Anaerophaga thermohalophila]